MNFIKTPTKGMRDMLPKDMVLREYVLKVMKEVYAKFGFELIQTPVVEHIENLTSKQGGENEKLIFKIMKRGEKLNEGDMSDLDSLVDSGLRYDLTVPLARFYANNLPQLSTPFRAFQVGNVYRAERSQKGRFREFMQCDLDILGEKTNLAEIELITVVITFLSALQFKNFTIRINDRRILTKMVEYVGFKEELLDSILIALDKLDKIGVEGVTSELLTLGLEEEKVKKYLDFFTKDTSSVKDFCASFHMDESVVSNLETIMETVQKNVDATLKFDPTLVRGMGYYTGPIFEIMVEEEAFAIGGGGRYDKMIEKYTNQPTPACGFSVGFERLLLLLEERGFTLEKEQPKFAYILSDENSLEKAYEEINQKRKEDSIVKVLYRSKNFKFQKETLEGDGYKIVEVN